MRYDSGFFKGGDGGFKALVCDLLIYWLFTSKKPILPLPSTTSYYSIDHSQFLSLSLYISLYHLSER